MYQKIHNFIIDISLKKKLLLINWTILLFIAIVSSVSVNLFMKYNEKRLYSNTANMLSFYSNEIKSALDSLVNSSYAVLSDDTVQHQLYNMKYALTNQKKATAYRTLYNSILNYSYTTPYTTAICLYTPSTTIWSNGNEAFLDQDDLKEIGKAAAEEKGSPKYMVLEHPKNQLILTRQIRRIEGTKLEPLATLIIGIDAEALINKSTYNNTLNDCFYTLRVGDSTVFNSNPSGQDTPIISRTEESYNIIAHNQHYYYVSNMALPVYGWSLECWLNYDDTIHSAFTGYFLFFLALACGILLSLMASGRVSGNISRHFYALIKKMQEFNGEADDIPKTEYDYTERKDEIGVVHRNFDAMAREQQRLIKDSYQAEMLMKNAQLKALEQQINPHFLYNTLEAINWHAKSVRETQISLIVESLGNLLHVTLDGSTRMITLEQELDLIRNYITIQQFRFGERLQFHLSAPDALMDTSIPKLSIQPLVENAIKYALEEITDICHIYINIIRSGKEVSIFVKNSGSQFEEHLLDSLKTNPEKSNGFGIGLINIDTRIQLTYGNSYGLEIYNENDMAVARIRIPCINTSNSVNHDS